jgi:5'-methylthioadenosine phosphorylase
VKDGQRRRWPGPCTFATADTLYGRYWGCSREYDCLHFETCYYQGIEYCIREGLTRFDPGAQGEHKIQRGFEPTTTLSCHWIAQPELDAASNRGATSYPGHANGIDFYYVHGHGRPSLQAAWVALYDLGVTEVIGGATAGGINPAMQPYDYVIPHDFIDMNVNRPLSFPREIYRDPDAIPIPRVYPAMDPDLRTILSEETRKRIRADSQFDDIDLHEAGVIVQARGGRFETAAEIRMFAQWGGDVVTMNVGTEIAYARMLGMNYACLIAISNPAEGVAPWDFSEMPPLYRRINPLSVEILMAALPRIAGLEGKPRVGDDLVFHPEMTSKPEGD